MQLKSNRRHAGNEGGFTLIEVLVTLVIVSIGMLGLAKLQAAAVAETSVSRTRSIMAYQAESLAGAMRANRAYWAAGSTPLPGFTVAAGATPGTYTDTSGLLPTHRTCVSAAPCSSLELAADDIWLWSSAFSTQFPSAAATVSCSVSTGPATCDITLTWGEHYVAVNRTTAATGAATTGTGTLVVHVQP